MSKRYYKNTMYRNIRIFHTKEVGELNYLEGGYLLAFQSNMTDNWYWWRNDGEAEIPLGLMRYLDNGTVFKTRVSALRSFKEGLKSSSSYPDFLQYQGSERDY